MSLTATWVDDPEAWSKYRSAWDALVERSERPSIYVTWDFLESCWRCFAPQGSKLAIIVLEEHGQVIGIAPLVVLRRQRFGLPLRAVTSLANWEATRAPLIFPPGRAEECMRATLGALAAHSRKWDYLQLNEVDPAGAVAQTAHQWAATARGYQVIALEASPSPYIGLAGGVDAWLASLGASSRKSFRRYQRQLEALGECRLEMFETPEEMPAALEAYLGLEARSWKPEAGQGVGKDQRNRDFYRELLPRLAAKRRVAIAFLVLNGQRIAANIEVWLGSTAYCPQTVFDKEFARYSPGNVIQVMTLRWHAERGITEYGLFGRFLDNKLRFTRDLRPNVNLRLLQMRGLRRAILLGPGLLKSDRPAETAAGPIENPSDEAGP